MVHTNSAHVPHGTSVAPGAATMHVAQKHVRQRAQAAMCERKSQLRQAVKPQRLQGRGLSSAWPLFRQNLHTGAPMGLAATTRAYSAALLPARTEGAPERTAVEKALSVAVSVNNISVKSMLHV